MNIPRKRRYPMRPIVTTYRGRPAAFINGIREVARRVAEHGEPTVGLAAITFEHPAWMATGECNGLDPNLFHPERGESSHHAKAVCAGCAVRELCADYAIEHRIAVGIWGGTSGRERRRLIAANVLALVPTLASAACGEPEGTATTEEANNAVYGTEVA